MIIRRAGPEDWRLVRDIRLQAMQDAPTAFGSSYEREASLSETDWHGRLTTSAWFVADEDGTLQGSVALVRPPSIASDEWMLAAMWIRSSARGAGLGRGLVDVALAWARQDGASAVVLSVTEGNESARRLYVQAGFRPTGDWSTFEDRPHLRLERFRLEL